MLVHAHSAGPARVTVRVSGRPARRPCVLYSVTGSNAQARDKLHGLVWLRSDFTVLVRLKHTSASRARGALPASFTGPPLARRTVSVGPRYCGPFCVPPPRPGVDRHSPVSVSRCCGRHAGCAFAPLCRVPLRRPRTRRRPVRTRRAPHAQRSPPYSVESAKPSASSTRPIRISAVRSIDVCRTLATISASVPTTRSSSGQLARYTTATGQSGP
ncbi:hypothetical protein DM81_3707 [Burkholderia multivorans]|nr:hypothetical protein DM81_3707 [Burkholderia multivorans]